MQWYDVVIPIATGIITLVIGAVVGYNYRMRIAEAKIGKAEDAVQKLLEDAQKKAETLKKEKILEAKEEVYRIKSENEKENRDRRNELQRSERRLQQREELLDNKYASIELREASLNKKLKDAEAMESEIRELHAKELSELERISGMTRDEAKEKEEQNAEKETREGDGRCGNHRRGNLDKRADEGEHHGCEKNIHITHNPSIPI